MIDGNSNYILQQIKNTVEYGEHNLLIYPNLHVHKEIIPFGLTRILACVRVLLFELILVLSEALVLV